MSIRGSSSRKIYYGIKRALDVSAAGVGLLLLWPGLLGIAWLIKLDSPGPAVFKQPRLGYRKRVFDVYKFRTMFADQNGQGPKPEHSEDARVTRMGRWLRRTSFDELPQLLNVLCGQMSLVGPRPEQLFLLECYPPAAHRRFEVKPGLTGWWQVNGRPQPMYANVAYDLYYVEHQSLWLDLKILAMTFGAVVNGKGAV